MWQKGIKAWATLFLSSGRQRLRYCHVVGDTIVSFLFIKTKQRIIISRTFYKRGWHFPYNSSGWGAISVGILSHYTITGCLPMLRVISEEYVWLCRLISYLNIYHLRYKDISCRYLPGVCDSCPSRWVPHNNIYSDMQQLTMDLLEEWFQLVTSWSPILLIDTSLGMHNIRQELMIWSC